jgi:hypothetical protein
VKAISKKLALASIFLAIGFQIILSAPFTKATNTGWSIDLFCQHGGIGENVSSSSPFVVGERISLFAYVTYNQQPVRSVLVAFQVNNPQGSPVLITTAQTNASGYAAANFTITEDVYPFFPSLWESIATASPAQHTVKDTMAFIIVTGLAVTISPTYALIILGNSVIFVSTVNGGAAPYYYQWYLNGNVVYGATDSTWTFTPTSPGTYYVYLIVTDSMGTKAKSNIAEVIVIVIPKVVGGRSIPADAINFFAPWLGTILLLTVAMMLKGIIIRKRRK